MKKSTGLLVLTGDFLHNFIDGIVIVLAFSVDVSVGIATTVAVLFHEFPQEVADFFILVHAGYARKKALLYNFLSSSGTLLGVFAAYAAVSRLEGLIGIFLGIVAGNFLYIAAADLIPELHEEHKGGRASTIKQFSLMLLGVIIMYIIVNAIPEA